MNELRTNLPAQHPPRLGRRYVPVLSWLTVVLLALNGWVYFASDGSTDVSTPADRSPVSLAKSSTGESPASSLENEFDGGRKGRVVTASATSFSPAANDERGAAGVENSTDETGTQFSDERCRQAILGEWYDDYRGKRHMTVRGVDGTGTMVVELRWDRANGSSPPN